MPIKPPTVDDLARIASSLRLGLSSSDLESFRRLLEPSVLAYARLDQLEEPVPVIKYPRDAGRRLRRISSMRGIGNARFGARRKGCLRARPLPLRTMLRLPEFR
jgi:hypothetical protein